MKLNNKELIEKAIKYKEEGLLPIAITEIILDKNGKKTFAALDKYAGKTKKDFTDEAIRKDFGNSNAKNIATLTGKESGVIVIDVDSGADEGFKKSLPCTVTAVTPNNGTHHYYKHPGFPVKTCAGVLGKSVDVRGDGGIAILPGSKIKDGNEYYFLLDLDAAKISELPEWLKSKLKEISGFKESKDIPEPSSDWFKFIEAGQRNDNLTRFAGKILSKYPCSEWESFCYPLVLSRNATFNKPPLEESEVRTVFESVKRYHSKLESEDINPITARELLDMKFESTSWIVDKLIPREGITFIAGNPGAGKTWILFNLIKSISSGQSFFNTFKVNKAGVLFIDEENGKKLLHERLLGVDPNMGSNAFFLSLSSFMLSEESVNQVITFCKNNSTGVVVFDSFVRLHDADENSARDMNIIFKHLKELTKNGLTVICTHHNRKENMHSRSHAQAMRGSSDILASIDCLLSVEKKNDTLIIRQPKLRQDQEIKPFELEIGSNFSLTYKGEHNQGKSKVEEAKEVILQVMGDIENKPSQKELLETIKARGFSLGNHSIRTALEELTNDEVLILQKGEKNASFYVLNN